jgi:site-specific DNA-methyltransferase (adenine-specific)
MEVNVTEWQSDDGRVRVLNCDCMDFMRGLPDGAFDLSIVDVPYGIGENGDRNASRGKLAIAKDYKPFAGKDASPPESIYFDELRRVSKNQIIWGANHFIDKLPFGCSSPCWIVWDKETGESDFADAELAWTSFKTAVRLFKFRWSGMLQGNMKSKEHRIHPTQKPVALYRWLLHNYAKEGDRILDTHGGSMSSVIACHEKGYAITCCELDADYYAAGLARVQAAMCQQTLDLGA